MNGNIPSVLNFNNYLDFLKIVAHEVVSRQGASETLETWAKRLGYKSPSSLSMVIKGNRLPSQELIDAISNDLNLEPIDRDYFQLLVRLEKLRSKGKSTESVLNEIYDLNEIRSNAFHVTHQQFSYISDWYHTAIKQLVSTPGFVEDAEWISKKLRNKVSPAKVRQAIENLLDVGILLRDDAGCLKSSGKGLETPNDEVISSALRNHHRQMLERAKESIDEQTLDQRYLNGLTLKIERSRIPEAKEFITRFMHEFGKEFSSKGTSDIYQLNLQLFEHTTEDYDLNPNTNAAKEGADTEAPENVLEGKYD